MGEAGERAQALLLPFLFSLFKYLMQAQEESTVAPFFASFEIRALLQTEHVIINFVAGNFVGHAKRLLLFFAS